MNRRNFLATIGTTSAAAWAGQTVFAAENQPSTPTPATPANGTPAVYGISDTQATIVWTLNAPARGWIEYGPTRDLGQTCQSDPMGFVPHDEQVLKITLRGLKPGATYYWRTATVPLAGGETQHSPVYQFRTLDAAATETHFAVWNDTHDRAETIRQLAALTHSEPADFLVWNGDLSNNINKVEVIPGIYVRPPGADLAQGPPILFSRGNHDVRGTWANKVTDYTASPTGRPFYAFRSGPLAVVVLDTGEDKPDRHPSFGGTAAFEPLIQEQKQWLAQVLQEPAMKNAPYRLAFCHIPLRWTIEKTPDYDNGGFDWFSARGRDAWQPALVAWGAHAVISGHMHQWACLPATAEQPYAQIVGGGPDLKNATVIRGTAANGELKIRILSITGEVLNESTYTPRT